MTDLWLHVNTFFIIVLIFFRYGSHIKKYMTVYFVCLFKLAFYVDGSFYFALLFLKNILPGTVKSVPAKLCVAFLCTLLNRLRFSPQNVEFGTKSTPSVAARQLPQRGALTLSGGAPLPSAPVGRSHLPQGDGLTLSVIAARCQISPFVAARHLPPERGKSFLSGGAFGAAANFPIMPNTLATSLRPWLSLRESWRGSA